MRTVTTTARVTVVGTLRLTFARASTTFVEHFGAVAKLVRQRTANPSFPGSNPGGTSKQHKARATAPFSFLPVTFTSAVAAGSPIAAAGSSTMRWMPASDDAQ